MEERERRIIESFGNEELLRGANPLWRVVNKDPQRRPKEKLFDLAMVKLRVRYELWMVHFASSRPPVQLDAIFTDEFKIGKRDYRKKRQREAEAEGGASAGVPPTAPLTAAAPTMPSATQVSNLLLQVGRVGGAGRPSGPPAGMFDALNPPRG